MNLKNETNVAVSKHVYDYVLRYNFKFYFEVFNIQKTL